MSKLVLPRELRERKQSQLKDSSAKKTQVKTEMRRLAQMREYKALKILAKDIANTYRSMPGTTPGEDASYLTHCKILWAYSTLFNKVEKLAQLEKGSEEKNIDDGW